MAKRPLVASILNFFVWGLGYLYLGERRRFGSILVVGEVIGYTAALVERLGGITLLSLLVIGLAFAYDAYDTAKS